MKKKLILCMLAGCLSMALFGCTAKDVMDAVAEKKAESKADSTLAEEMTEEEATEEPEAEEAEVTEETDAEPETEEVAERTSDTPVLGDEAAENYEGFEYLFGGVLMTDAEENEETGKKERDKLFVFIPDADYANVSGNRAYSDYLGVDFRVELSPYLRYNAEDYLMEENLQYYMENEYDPFYSTDYKDLVVSDVEVLSKTACMATAEYCYYNKWDDSYETIFQTYYLAEVDDGVTVLVEIEIHEDEVTGKTPALLEELEQFYQFSIDWDADRAAAKREAYIATGGDNKYSTGYMLFELPSNWSEVEDGVSYDENVYAPEGDVAYSGCMISLYREYLSYDENIDIKALVGAEEETKELLEAGLGMEVVDFSLELTDTVLGKAAKMTYTATSEELSGSGVTYFVAEDYYFYTLQAFAVDGADEDPSLVLDLILQTAEVND